MYKALMSFQDSKFDERELSTVYGMNSFCWLREVEVRVMRCDVAISGSE